MRMKKNIGLKKRIMAFMMAAVLLGATVLPDCVGIAKYLTMESYAMAPGDNSGLTFNLTMLPNSGKQKLLPAWSGLYNTNMMRKEYFNPGSGTGEYTDFAGKYIWCVANHTVHAPVGAAARVYDVFTYEHLPESSLTRAPIDKFNFTVAILALYYFANPTNLTDKYADTADYLIAKCIIAPAFETGELKNEWEFDQMRILNVLYGYYAEEFNPDTNGSTLIHDQLTQTGYKGPYGMDVDYAMYKVWQVWSAAHALCEMDWTKGVGYAKAVTEPEMGSDGKYHVYAEFNADAENEKYFQDLQCKTTYGDWTYEGYSDKKMDFSSPTGTIPAEGIADMSYALGSSFENIFTNFDEGQLVQFKFDGGYQDMLASKLTGDFSVRIGTSTATPEPHGGEGGEVERFEHEETWNATYNVELYKLDSETGKGLSGSIFDILESFDDSQLDSTSLDLLSAGSYSGDGSLVATEWGTDDIASNWDGDLGYSANDADLYNWGNDDGSQFEKWTGTDDPCTRDNDITNNAGHLMQNNGMDEASNTVAHTDVKTYTYHKGYCGGHPAPEIEYAELTGDPKKDPAIIEANQTLHDEAWTEWAKGVEDCQKLAAEGGFFHAINAGEAKAAMQADRDQFYEDFISLTYDYSAVETRQRDGYILHGGHVDDIPIETVTVTSSESKGGSSLMMTAPKMLKSAKPASVKAEEDKTYLFGSSLSAETASEEEHAKLLETGSNDDTADGSADKTKTEEEVIEIITETGEDEENVSEPEVVVLPATAVEEAVPAAESEETAIEAAKAEEVSAETAEKAEEAASTTEASEESAEESTEESESTTEESVAEVSFLGRLFGIFNAYAEEPAISPDFVLEEDLASPSAVKKSGADTPAETTLTGFFKSTAKKAKKLMKGLLLGGSGGGTRASTSFGPSDVSPHAAGDSSIVDHTFIVYDHRVEGEVHINKRDFDLSDSDKTNFDDYAMTNGDGTLEGAVYGLFARTDIKHPDSDGTACTADDTGILFHADELVSVATTDRDGNATFSVITVAPGQTWDYATGGLKTTGAFSGATNMHVAAGSAETKRGTEKYSGVHGPIPHTKSASDTDAYMKQSSNTASGGYPIRNNSLANGNCWIGRPLLLGEYYVKELTRSEGYELSVYGESHTGYSNRTAFESAGGSLVEGTASVVDGSWNVNDAYTGNIFEVTAGSIGDAGFDIYVNNVPAALQSALTPTVKSYYMKNETGTATVMVDDYANLPVDATPGAFVLIGGNKVEATAGDSITLPNGATVTVNATTAPGDAIETFKPNNLFSKSVAGAIIEYAYTTDADFIAQGNASLLDAGYEPATTASPYLLLPKTGTRADWCKAINDTLKDMLWCNAFTIEDVTASNIVLRYDYIQTSPLCKVVSDTQHSRVLVAEPLTIGTTAAHVWVPYEMADWITYSYKTGTYVEKMSAKHKIPSVTSVPDGYDLSLLTFVKEPAKTYWVYSTGEKLRDTNGNIVMQMVKTGSHPETQTITKAVRYYDSAPKFDTVTYDAAHSRFVIHVTKAQSSYTVPSDYAKIGYELLWASATAGGISSCYYALNNLKITAAACPKTAGLYIRYVTLSYNAGDVLTDGGTKEAPVAVTERPIRQRVSVKKDIALNADTDGDGKPDSYRDNTYGVAIDTSVADFKFKAYLKSNLERLYRKADGTVQWVDENGNFVTPVLTDEDGDGENDTVTWKYDDAFGKKTVDWPEIDGMVGTSVDSLNVQPIYTAVSHETSSRTTGRISNNVFQEYKDPTSLSEEVASLSPYSTILRAASGKAVKTNASLFSYSGKNTNAKETPSLKDAKNTGYTRILETEDVEREDGASLKTIQSYNYDKFFSAVSVANGDKWDEGKPTYTSWRPIGNKANRSAYAIDNAKRSDRVRQFAVDWYLSDEVAKLVQGVEKSKVSGKYTEDEAKAALSANNYSEALFDEALNKAIKKAEDYLKPFFKYDLDCIYSLQWDTDADGGTDTDFTTLSANKANTRADGNDEYLNTSAYLPYGVYIVVEQQPGYDGTDPSAIEYLNKHYSKDRPKEVLVPSVYDGTVNDTADNLAAAYQYKAADSMAEMSKSSKFLIRFGEEWREGDDSHKWTIKAHSYYGNFEVYPFGLDVDKLSGGASYKGFSIVQDEYEPLKDYYDTKHRGEAGVTAIGTERGGNDGAKWEIYELNTGYQPTANGTTAYDAGEHIHNDYFYASISEDAGLAKNVPFTTAPKTGDNGSGTEYKDVNSMTGVLTAYEGKYAQMLVPWSVTDAADYNTYVTADFEGYADVNVADLFYSAKLRIEKLDAETHENILHDDAVFAIYKAQRDTTTGDVKFYAVDTDITGSKEFITAYCDARTVMPVDPADPSGLYQGTVKAGTPICSETDLVILGDKYGNQTSEFKAFSTAQDLPAKTESGNFSTDPATYITQNVGYIETPQPLGAGVYVLVEKKAPSGYVRTAPVAVEVYSDKVTYYKEGNKDSRVLAAIYEEASTSELTANGNKPQDTVNVAEVYVEDQPIKLTVEKVKESSVSSADTTVDKTVTYKVSGRENSDVASFAGREDLVLAYNAAGTFQGYAWKKGTLEYLANLKQKYDTDGDPLTKVEIVYDASVFAGYGFVTLPLLTADDTNKYAVGAELTLYDALQLRRNPAFEFGKSDKAFSFMDGLTPHGLVIKRDPSTNRVTRMYVEKSYAGTKTVFKAETDSFGNAIEVDYQTGYDKTGKPVYTHGNVWNAVTVEREDTDILYYDLDSLEVTFTADLGNGNRLYGYDRNHKPVDVLRLVNDLSYDKNDNETSLFVWKGSLAVFEIVGGDLSLASYDAAGKSMTVDSASLVYHLDSDGNRDAMVDPHTGMAYVIEKCDDGHGGTYDKYLVWPVEIHKDSHGYVVARDKITTSRVATIGENVTADEDPLTSVSRANDPAGDAVTGTAASYEHKETGSVTGTYESLGTGESHQQTTDRVTKYGGNNLNGETLVTDNNGTVAKKYSPVYDKNGNILYYQRSDETYDKGTDLYDRDDDFVRHDTSDDIDEYNAAAYKVNGGTALVDESNKLYHRYGEGYVLQNTWVSSDETPNDPFRTLTTDGQADILKRVPEGLYIMEELSAPAGYTKAFPAGVTVSETSDVQYAKMVDRSTKMEIAKIDGQEKYKVDLFDMTKGGVKIGSQTEGTVSYSYEGVVGAVLALYPAKRVYTPDGSHLEKTSVTPFVYESTNSKVSAVDTITCQWTTDGGPIYLEGIPQGLYILEELSAPAGFVKAAPVEIEIGTSTEVKEISVSDDHTKLEIEKYYLDSHTYAKKLLPGAVFELHEATVDGGGNIILDGDGNPTYQPAVLADWKTVNEKEWPGFAEAFRDLYRSNGTDTVTVAWTDGNGVSHTASRTACEQLDQTLAGGPATKFPTKASMTFADELGRVIKVAVYEQRPGSGTPDYTMDFAFDVKSEPALGLNAVSYSTAAGIRRFDYIDVTKKYVAVEKTVPTGYMRTAPKAIVLNDTADIQRYSIENRVPELVISKVLEGQTKEAEGVALSLYRAESGALVQDTAHLVASWVTGTDGSYNEADLFAGRIVSGYGVGDLRPHTFSALPAGEYYLVETVSPGYYKCIEPLKIDYTDVTELKFVRVTNVPVKGSVVIHKEDEDGNALSGATFLLRRYDKDNYLDPSWESTYVMTSGTLTINDLPVGKVLADGTVEPYRYRISEILPPEGYQISNRAYNFSFRENNGGASYEYDSVAEYSVTVTDRKTSFRLSKKTLLSSGTDESDSAYIDGAVLKVYELLGTDMNGAPIYDTSVPLRSFTLSGSTHEYEIVGLSAGKSYVVAETFLPDGLDLMEPHMFAISADGRKLTSLSSKLNGLTFNGIAPDDYKPGPVNPDTDSIKSVKMAGRYVVSVTYEVTDAAGTVIETYPGGYDHEIDIATGYTDGASYTITEKVTYSDGTVDATDSCSKLFRFDETGKFTVTTRTVEKVSLALRYDDGDLIEELLVTDTEHDKTVINTVSAENPVYTMTQTGREEGDPIERSYSVKNSVTITNPDHKASDATITIVHTGMNVISAGAGTVSGNTITFTAAGVSAFGTKTFTYFTTVTGKEAKADITVSVGGRTITSTKRVPCVLPNNLTLFHEVTGSGKEVFADEEVELKVQLYNHSDGSELLGYYDYAGSKYGALRSGDSITLKANEYIQIDTGVYHDVDYVVTRYADGRTFVERGLTGNVTNVLGSFAYVGQSFLDTSERDIFHKGVVYDLYETTVFSDGEKQLTNRMRFALGENASVEKIGLFDGETKAVIEKLTPEGTALSDCVLEIYDASDVLVDTWTTGGTKHVLNGILVSGQTYRLHEKTSRVGYTVSADITFVANTADDVDRIVMVDKPTWVEISKKTITGSDELPGCTLEVRDAVTDALIETWVSTDTVHTIKAVLEAGKSYKLIETHPKDGYAYADTITFTVSLDGAVDRVEMIDKPTDVVIRKTDVTETEEIPGCTLEIRDAGGDLVETWISGTEPHEIKAKLIADAAYTLVEAHPADGYYYADDITFTVSHDGSIDTVIMKDRKTRLEVSKKTLTGSDELPGCRLEIKDAETGVVVDGWTSGTAPHIIEGVLLADHKYILTEVRPADGYAYAEDIAFTMSRDGKVADKVEMRDDTTKVKISKLDIADGTELPGATLTLRDKNGVVIDEWVSGTTPHYLEAKLIAGETYTLTETAAPDGYAYAETITFTVSTDGSLDVVVMSDARTRIEISKTKGLSENLLPGAKLQILLASDRSVVCEFVTTEEIYKVTGVLLAGEKYILHEVESPAGYLLSGDIEFTVPTGATILPVKMADMSHVPDPPIYAYSIRIRKYDAATGTNLAGAEFAIFNSLGAQVAAVTTDSSGFAVWYPAVKDKYTVKETKAPEGYTLIEDIFTADLTVKYDVVISVPNSKADRVVIKKIDAATGEPLPGAELEVMTDKGDIVLTAITDEHGEISFIPTYYGNYVCYELKAPPGYRYRDRSDYYITFTVTEDGAEGTFEFENFRFIGRIELRYGAEYPAGITDGWIDRDGVKHPWNPLSDPFRKPLGDTEPYLPALAVIAAGLAAALVFRRKRKSVKD